MDEIWKEIAGWNGKYLISNFGRVKSIGGKYKLRYPDGYITLGCIDTLGYHVFILFRPGHKFRQRVHALVANAFLEKPTHANCVNHKDGNKLNNHVDNLEWTTRGDNVRHAVKTGLLNIKGEKHPLRKLTEENVIEMRKMRKSGMLYEDIAKKFNVCRRQAGDVINGVNWGWLKEGL